MNGEITFQDALESGVYILIPLALLLIAACVIWLKRVSAVRKELIPPGEIMARVRDYVIEGDLENARQLCQGSDSAAGEILSRGVSRIGYPIAEVANSMQEVLDVEDIKLETGLRWLKAIAVIAPLLGTIGTLTGMAIAFHAVAEDPGIFDGAMLCEMLSPTFITVISGLAVGIISLCFFTGLDGIVQKTQNRLAALCVEFLDLLNEPS